MSEPFDPDEYLKAKEEFDPDAYLAEAVAPAAAPVQEPSTWGSAINTARGAVASVLQGPAMQWADEAAGLLGERDAALKYMVEGGQKPNLEQEYRDGREAFRNVENAFRAENPAAAFALTTASGALLGGPVQGAAKKGFGRYLPALVEGGISGAGAALESEDIPQAAVIGAPFSVGGQALGEAAGAGIGAAARWVSGKAGQRVADATARAAEMEAQQNAKEVLSASGSLGAKVQSGNRAVENMMRLSGKVSEEEQAVLDALEASGAAQRLRDRLAQSVGEDVPAKVAEIDAAQAQLQAVLGRTDAEREAARQAILSGGEAKQQIMARVKRYLPTLIGAIAGADKKGILPGAIAGYALGGTPGSALIGGLSGSALRPAFHAVGRMAQHPAVQSMAFRPIQKGGEATAEAIEAWMPAVGGGASRALRGEAEAEKPRLSTTSVAVEGLVSSDPSALGPYAQKLQQAQADGNLSLVHYTLQQTDPEYRALLEQARTGVSP
jgi:hypothetical protein